MSETQNVKDGKEENSTIENSNSENSTIENSNSENSTIENSNSENSTIRQMRAELEEKAKTIKEYQKKDLSSKQLVEEFDKLKQDFDLMKAEQKNSLVQNLANDLHPDFKDLLLEKLSKAENPKELLNEWEKTKPSYFAKRKVRSFQKSAIDKSKLSPFAKAILDNS